MAENEDTVQTVQTSFFDDKCRAYIEGMRFVPEGESWQRSDGVVFVGEMAAPIVDFAILEAAQSAYEDALFEARSEYESSLTDVELALAEIYEMVTQV